MQVRLSECVPIYNLKEDITFLLKMEPSEKDTCDYTDIVMDEVDKFLVDFSFNDLSLDIYVRYRDVIFIPWSHGIENLSNFKET